MGNRLRGDDGVGPCLIDRIKGQSRLSCLDAGAAPENCVDKILKEEPDTILFVDAAHLGLPPGHCQILDEDAILHSGCSTHDIPLSLLIKYIAGRSSAKILLLAVQPQQTALGSSLSPAVQQTLDKLSAFFVDR